MAVRPVFLPSSLRPFRTHWKAEFVYNSGLAPSQKQKNITTIHKAFQTCFPERRVLEISSKSMQEGGTSLSAFNLRKYVPSLGQSIPVENIYHASKVFRSGGPYPDLLTASPREAKRDERLRSSGPMTGFRLEGEEYPLVPQTAFYDYLYINALLENEDLAKIVLSYDAFTDIEFNPEKSISCQAQSAALFVSLHRMNLLDKARQFDSFVEVLTSQPAVRPVSAAPVPAEKPAPAARLSTGMEIRHKLWGTGTITAIAGTIVSLEFPGVGQKKLGMDWILNNCELPGEDKPTA